MHKYRGWNVYKGDGRYLASCPYDDDLDFEARSMDEVYARVNEAEDVRDAEQEELERDWAESLEHERIERSYLR